MENNTYNEFSPVPQGNGLSEWMVQTVNNLLKKV